jgi:hypothetical protein
MGGRIVFSRPCIKHNTRYIRIQIGHGRNGIDATLEMGRVMEVTWSEENFGHGISDREGSFMDLVGILFFDLLHQ